jgi:hypothetical protein
MIEYDTNVFRKTIRMNIENYVMLSNMLKSILIVQSQ